MKDFVKFVFFQIRNIPTYLKEDIDNFPQFEGETKLIAALAKQYVLHYPVNQNENVYKQIEQDPNQILKLTNEFINAFKIYDATL